MARSHASVFSFLTQNWKFMSLIGLVSIKRSEVPEYLHASELYLSFDPEETDDELSVPSNCLKRDLLIHNSADLMDLLLTMRYWILQKCSASVVVDLLYGHESDFIREMVKNISEAESVEPCDLAAKFGRVDFLDFFTQTTNTLSIQTLMIAAENGHIDCLSYCYEALSRTGPCLLNQQDWRDCICTGNFECLPFLVESGVSTVKLLALSIKVCSAKCIKFLHDQLKVDCWTPSTVATAAQMGKKKLVMELNENELGCPWDESAPIAALKADAADCLQYLIDERGIPESDAFRNVNLGKYCSVVLTMYQMKQDIAKQQEERIKMEKKLQKVSRRFNRELRSLTKKVDALAKSVERTANEVTWK